MQRYRINYHWLIGVFAGAFVLAVAAFFVWRWQVERNASTFLTQAEEAVAAGNSADAFEFYGKYVKLRPKEDDARIKMATAALDMIKDPDISWENRSLALGTVDQTVRTTDDNVLRRELAELMMLLGRPQGSLPHIQDLLVDNPQDPELNAMQVRALFRTKDRRVKQMALDLIGYNKDTDEFDADQALLKTEPDVYSLLAEELQTEDKDVELARRVIDRMVEINPESAQANLQKSVFLQGLGEREAKDYLDKAYQLDPKDAAIISGMGIRGLIGFLHADSKDKYFAAVTDYELAVVEVADKDRDEVLTKSYSKAKEEFEAAVTGLERNKPSYEEAKAKFFEAKASFEQALGELAAEEPAAADDADCQDALERFGQAKTDYAASLPDYEEAKKYFAAGMEEHPEKAFFYRYISDVENRLGNKAEAVKILDKGIRELDRTRSIDLVIFKIDLLINNEDFDAVDDELKRMTLLNRPDLQPIIDFEKARVLFYQKEWVEAARELRRVRPLLYNRRNIQVFAGTMLGVCYERQGSTDQAKQAYTAVLNDYPNHEPAKRGLARVEQRIDPTQRGDGVELDQVVNATLELPKEEQDWDKIDKLVEQVIKDRGIGEARANLMRAKVLIKREMYQESKDLIKQAYRASPDDIDVNYAAVLLVLSNPTEGPEAAMKTLDRLEKKWGVSLRSLAQRAEIIMRLNPEDVTEQLRGLETEAAEFSDLEKLQLVHVLGLRFEQLGKNDEAREYYQRAAQQDTTNLPVRMRLFDLALRQKDDAAMQQAQAAILEIVKSKDSSYYLLTEAKRLILNYGMQRIGRDELAKVRDLLDKALIERSEWHELHITYGQLNLLLDGDMDAALEHFDKALESGPARSNAVSIQVKLLYERGLFNRARERMELLSKEQRPKLLGRLEAEILFKTGDKERAFLAAEKLAESRPNDASTQVWFSKMAQDAGRLDVAATVLRGAQQLNPGDPDSWLRLIGMYTEQRKFDEVRTINREAHLASDAEFLPLLTAKFFELQSRWQNAESIYLATYGDDLDNLTISRRMADFYLLWASKDETNIGRASTHINRILRAANEGKVPADNPHVMWARQKAARILHAGSNYQHSLKAERLLKQSAVNNEMNLQETELLADILVNRGDPQSLMQAKELLTDLRDRGRLYKKGALQLAHILSQTGQWSEAKALLTALLGDRQYKNDADVQLGFINLLIDQGEYSSAGNRIRRLRSSDPANPRIVELSARLAAEKGDMAELEQLLSALVPKKLGALTEAQLNSILGIAQLAERYGAYDLAGNLFKLYTDRVPSQSFHLARFHANHGDCDLAVELMKRLFSDNMDAVAQLASRMISVRRNEFEDKYDDAADMFIDRAVRDDPDSVSRLLVRAEAFDVQGKHAESIKEYDRLLQRDDLPLRLRAAAMNNLGFQLGLLNQRVDEAEQLINDAMQTFGPVADMLDTRAIVRIAQQKYDLAIEDMELAISVSQDPVKFFHMAKACILAGDGQAALQAWEKAQELGFEKESLPALEKDEFDQILQKIESFQTQNAKL